VVKPYDGLIGVNGNQIRAQLGTMRSRIPEEDMCSRAHAKMMQLHILVLISQHTEQR